MTLKNACPALPNFLKTISGATLNIHPEISLASLPEMLSTHPIYYGHFLWQFTS